MYTITRILEFDAGHRVVNHESKCKNFHGHRYKVEATLISINLDNLGRVIDFGIVKQILGKWIDDNWDHTMILNIKDKKFGDILEAEGNKKVYYLNENPTAEYMALYLLNKANELLCSYNILCQQILLWETPNCNAVARLNE